MADRTVHRVAILGGGIAGLSAAHELAELNGDGPVEFAVTVYERNPIFGGKARSFPKPGTGRDGRGDLPGEHGFRFFPSYYRHVPHTMGRIPYVAGGERRTVVDNLVDAEETHFACTDGPVIRLPTGFPTNLRELAEIFRFGGRVGISYGEALRFGRRMLSMFCASDERRYQQYERRSWFDFSGANEPTFGEPYRKYLADGLNQRTVAASGRDVSARTVGVTLVRIVSAWLDTSSIDRVLNGPTSDRWITPWKTYLEDKGVHFVPDANLTRLVADGSRIAAAELARGGATERVEAESFVAAVPLESMVDVARASDIFGGGHGFDDIVHLSSDRMNGVQYYLDRPLPLAHGHTIYVDSPFALTSISQQQFWNDIDLGDLGDGQVRDVLSVDISEWDQRCPDACHGKTALEMTRQEIQECVWRQVEEHVRVAYGENITSIACRDSFLDPAIEDNDGSDLPRTRNREPLFINRVDSWDHRPPATTGLDNLYLAADYVKTETDLATMEAANEAGRRAVRGLLDRVGDDPSRVALFSFREPSVFSLWRKKDHDHVASEVVGFADLPLEPAELPEEWGPSTL